MKQPENIKAILARYRKGEATEQDNAFLESWYHWHGEREVPAGYTAGERLADAEAIWRRLQRKPRRLRRWLPYAAAVFIATTAAAWIFYGDKIHLTAKTVNQKSEDIAPGGNRATLTLADGRTIDLSEEQSGIVVADGITYPDGSLVLPHTRLATHNLRLTTPKGGTYQITLPDGSNVWLNAASTLKYPSRFDDERVVELEGEAYFEVRKSERPEDGKSTLSRQQKNAKSEKRFRPFKVLTAGQAVEVMGTEFNISAYTGEPETKTTLVEGSVQVSLTTNHRPPVTINPGEQVVVRDSNLDKIKVDIAAATAWKSGKFNFDGKPFHQVMNEVGRWYDLEVVYEGNKPTGQLVGDAYRNQNLSIVLGMLDVLEIDYKLDVSRRKLTIIGTKGGNP